MIVIDNLYHESLHHALFSSTDVDGFAAPLTVEIDLITVEVPWHDTRWPLLQAYHAWFVYSHLTPFRRRCLDRLGNPIFRSLVQDAAADAEDCARILGKEVRKHRAILGRLGEGVLCRS
jgi:hypothetical protein